MQYKTRAAQTGSGTPPTGAARRAPAGHSLFRLSCVYLYTLYRTVHSMSTLLSRIRRKWCAALHSAHTGLLRGKSTSKLRKRLFSRERRHVPLRTLRYHRARVLLLVGGRGLSLGARRRVLLEQREARRLGLGGDVDRGELQQHLAPQRFTLVRVGLGSGLGLG